MKRTQRKALSRILKLSDRKLDRPGGGGNNKRISLEVARLIWDTWKIIWEARN